MISLILTEDFSFEQDLRELCQAFFPGETFIHKEDEASLLCVRADNSSLSLVCGPELRERAESAKNTEIRGGVPLCLETAYVLTGDRSKDKSMLKKRLYSMLSGLTGRELPWGDLTGIRPVKLYENSFRETGDARETERRLKELYLISDEKLGLLSETAAVEREALSGLEYEDGFSLYVGVPFCPSTCLYCSFTSNPIERFRNRIGEYLEALRLELRLIRELQLGACGGEKGPLFGKQLQTIYVGGGTPTSLSAEELSRLLSMLEEELDLGSLRELTVEAGRPDSIDRQKLRALRNHGVGRISINPQTMNDRTLRLIGRRHTAEDVERAFYMARDEGFCDINMDIIMGLPEEDISDVEHTLSCIRRFSPESLTVHALFVKRAARLSTEGLAYSGLSRAGEVDAGRMIEMGRQCSRKLDMRPYYLYRQKNMAGNQENVGYSLSGRENLYNILMMEEKHTVVGIGAGSTTKLVLKNEDPSLCAGNENRVERHENIKNVEIYLERFTDMLKKKKAFLTEK